MKEIKEESSVCCNANKIIQGSAEGTHYYACQNCKKEFINSTKILKKSFTKHNEE